MKTLLLVFVMFVTAMTAEAEEFKMATWEEYLRGLQFAQLSGGSWNFVYEGRVARGYVMVQVPPGIMSIQDFVPLHTKKGQVEYVIFTDKNLALDLRDQKGVKPRQANVRLIFLCSRRGEEACMKDLAKLLKEGTVMGSLGVEAGSDDYQRSGILPDSKLFVGFLLSVGGKFDP